MVHSTNPDELAQLRAALAAQHDSTRALQARLTRLERRRHIPRHVLPLLVITLLVALMPLSLLAAGPTFSDLNNAAAEHRHNIQAIGDAGITTGFADPNNPNNPNVRIYDPKATVTREEMASFLARTAGLGGNPAVANAATVGGFTPGNLARLGFGEGWPREVILTSSPYRLANVAVTPPGPGYILITSSVLFQTDTPQTVTARLVDTGVANPQPIDNSASPGLAARLGAIDGGAVSLSPTYIFTVTNTTPHTYALEVTGATGVASKALNPTITALYIPFGLNGSFTPTPAP